MANPTIVSISPFSNSVGIPTNTKITVTFDQEIDSQRLLNGGILLEGPESSKAIGAGLLSLSPPQTDENDFLSSPGFDGLVPIRLELRRVDSSGNPVSYYDYGDTSGTGTRYRTQVVITPKIPLAALTQYTIYIIGDENLTDSYEFGLSTRTVFDPIKGPNLGDGDIDFFGGFTGTSRKRFFVEIITSGGVGVSTFEWWTSQDPTHRSAISSSNYILLEDEVRARFYTGKSYVDGDVFSVWCDVPEFMDGSYRSSFTTSSYEAETFPSPSTMLGGSSFTSSSLTGFSVLSTHPANRSALISLSTVAITVIFSADLDSTSITDSRVVVTTSSVDGSEDGSIPYLGILIKTLSISGSTLTITLDAEQLLYNNIVSVVLNSSISDKDSNTLGADYEFFFGTIYTPYFSTIRMVRLRLGRLGRSIPDETIALAIWDASTEAISLSPFIIRDADSFARARREFTTCMATWILISGVSSGTSSRKRLSDFDVSKSYGPGGISPKDLEDCISKWQVVLEFGGARSAEPLIVVKGDTAIDEPIRGRLWLRGDRTIPINNAKINSYPSRRWYTSYSPRNR